MLASRIPKRLPHVLDLLQTSASDRWLILGKGPSFDANLARDLFADGYRLCSINNAFDGVSDIFFDLCVFVDWRSALKFQAVDVVETFATCAMQHRNIPQEEKNVAVLLRQMSCLGDLPMLAGFDIMGMSTYPARQDIHCVTSSTEAAFHILCLAGAQHIHMNGIDGGMSYHDTFASESRNGHGRLDGQFDGIGKIARNHAVTGAGLRPEIYDRYNIPRKSH